MKVLVWEGPGQVTLREYRVPQPGPGEALIRSVAVGLCGSDVDIYDGVFGPASAPLVLGHESAGVIEALGSERGGYASRLQLNARVVVDPNVGCGHCHFCRLGAVHLCHDRKIIGMAGWNGSLAEYFVAPAQNVFAIPDSLSWLEAAAMDSLANPLHGLNQIPIAIGESAAILGMGASGLCFVQLCRLRGMSPIVAIDINEWRLKKALEFGADAVVNAAQEDSVTAIRRHTDGLGAHVVIEASGARQAVVSSIHAARSGGKVLIYGVYREPVNGVDFQDQHRREITMYGSTGAAHCYATAIELAASGRVKLAPMITHLVSLDDLPLFFADGVIRGPRGDFLKAVAGVDTAIISAEGLPACWRKGR